MNTFERKFEIYKPTIIEILFKIYIFLQMYGTYMQITIHKIRFIAPANDYKNR
jgi:hypothetical protein